MVQLSVPALEGCPVVPQAGRVPAFHEARGRLQMVSTEALRVRVPARDREDAPLHVSDHGHGYAEGSVSDVRFQAEGN